MSPVWDGHSKHNVSCIVQGEVWEDLYATANVFQVLRFSRWKNVCVSSFLRGQLQYMRPPDKPDFVCWQDGTSPLLLAAQNGHVDICKILLDHQASVNLQSSVSGFSRKSVLITHRCCSNDDTNKPQNSANTLGLLSESILLFCG